MDVYPRSRTVWTAILFMGALAVIFVVWGIVAVAHGPKRSDWIVLFGLAFFPLGTWRAIGQLRRPLPWAHLDEEGIDCAIGRVPWTNVANARVAWHWVWAGRGSHPSRRLFLDLRDPTQAPAANAREYLSSMPFGGPVDSDGKIRLPLWDPKENVLADIGRYYPAGGATAPSGARLS